MIGFDVVLGVAEDGVAQFDWNVGYSIKSERERSRQQLPDTL
ncbi:hypothetical protein QP938_04120 [Porticoccaceae bacterium LTM1]|nr:hypothetical protein QP938_04120 [Porticoccaceae bacterium LTM1]